VTARLRTARGLIAALATASLIAVALAAVLLRPRASLRPVRTPPAFELDEPAPQ
jgi:hypothetical protein